MKKKNENGELAECGVTCQNEANQIAAEQGRQFVLELFFYAPLTTQVCPIFYNLHEAPNTSGEVGTYL